MVPMTSVSFPSAGILSSILQYESILLLVDISYRSGPGSYSGSVASIGAGSGSNWISSSSYRTGSGSGPVAADIILTVAVAADIFSTESIDDVCSNAANGLEARVWFFSGLTTRDICCAIRCPSLLQGVGVDVKGDALSLIDTSML